MANYPLLQINMPLLAASLYSMASHAQEKGIALQFDIVNAVLESHAPEHELTDYITRNTRLQTTDGSSDIRIEGEITGYNLSPQAVTEDAYASKTRLTIQVRVRYTDNKRENKDIDQTFSAYRDFDSSEMLTEVQDQLCEEISKELVTLIFNATLGDW